MNNSSSIDTRGPWFDGVALLKDKEMTKPLDRTFQNASYDLAVITGPMPLVRNLRLPALSDLLATAIDSYPCS